MDNDEGDDSGIELKETSSEEYNPGISSLETLIKDPPSNVTKISLLPLKRGQLLYSGQNSLPFSQLCIFKCILCTKYPPPFRCGGI